jgi:hypothetical protein
VFLDLSFSNKLSEYIVKEKAVLCANLRSIRSYFSDDALQYFEANSSSDLAKKMLQLYENADLRRRLSERASVEYHPIRWEIMRNRYIRLTASLLIAPAFTKHAPLRNPSREEVPVVHAHDRCLPLNASTEADAVQDGSI